MESIFENKSLSGNADKPIKSKLEDNTKINIYCYCSSDIIISFIIKFKFYLNLITLFFKNNTIICWIFYHFNKKTLFERKAYD